MISLSQMISSQIMSDYVVFSFVKRFDKEIVRHRFDYIVPTDSMKSNSSFVIYPLFTCLEMLNEDFCGGEQDFNLSDTTLYHRLTCDIDDLIGKYSRKIETINVSVENGIQEEIIVYATPVRGVFASCDENHYLSQRYPERIGKMYFPVEKIINNPNFFDDTESTKYLYNRYNYVPVTAPFNDESFVRTPYFRQ